MEGRRELIGGDVPLGVVMQELGVFVVPRRRKGVIPQCAAIRALLDAVEGKGWIFVAATKKTL
jgi:hypothetical protein